MKRRGPNKLGGGRQRGTSPRVHMALTQDQYDAVTAWARAQEITISEAVRRLITLGLEVAR